MAIRRIAFLLVCIAVAAGAAWWALGRGTPVTVAAVVRGTAAEIVYATGVVEPVRWAKVASVVRERIIDICDCEGRAVAVGDVLARLDDRELRAQLQEHKAREDFAKREVARQTELIGRGASTTQAHERVSSELRQIQALISVQMERLDDYTITAPMDGVVLRRDGEIGELADIGQVLFRIGVLKPLQVVAEVNEEDIPRVGVGQAALLRTDAFPDGGLRGAVREITPMGDPVTKTYRIRIALPDETPLKPGMSVEVNIVTREKSGVLLIPADALRANAVHVVDADRARRRAVKIGIRGSRAIEVIAGLSEGERIVAPAMADNADDMRVRVIGNQGATP
ncbi:MAG: efflux RND transporter periplasmic adaptor subunit [Proteobacteria bacterium]|nr:efflux RND transporter periplasmic adaptor subunit [Pseudomonadota bacterium]